MDPLEEGRPANRAMAPLRRMLSQVASKGNLHVVFMPLVVLAALLTGGILGVKYGIKNAYDSAR